ncbi:MAG TPA: primosomal protein N' [Burkholderiales bacterium]|nr:primosomal protein N' [Burkholderiales bacterium]
MKVLRVGLDVPVDREFEYFAPDATDDDVGRRAVVPFGRRMTLGVVLGVSDHSIFPAEKLKRVTRILRDSPALSSDDLALLRFAADYYHYPLGQVVMNALPVRLRKAESAGRAEEVEYVLTHLGQQQQDDAIPRRALVKRRLLAALRQCALTRADVRKISASAPAALREFEATGWVERRVRARRAAASAAGAACGPALNDAQAAAVDAVVQSLGTFRAFMLRGVTGSGKTEVYLHIAERTLERGGQVLMLVPEIALTPQLEAMVQARFPGAAMTSLHSGLNETERARNWLAAQAGEASIVLGTRLAVFASLPRLALIVVDEEHDASFKQTEGFCYSARDLAVVRASQRAVPVVLGSATPALETYHNAQSGRYTPVELPARINGRPPNIACVSVRGAQVYEGLAPEILDAIGRSTARGEQALVFINRRGWAPVLMCHACGWLSGCKRCSAQLVLHLPARELHCHHCGHLERVPAACPTCGNPDLSPIGQGTQRVEAALAQRFPDARILRIDRDTTRRRNAWNDMRKRIQSRDVDILVGTQILAKGHDFPHLALVCVLNADAMLYSADFRASERLYALLTQVAGRAGRGVAQGEVLIQTEFPHHPLYAALQTQDFAGYAETLLDERRTAGFPPYRHQVLLRAEAPEVATALEFLEHAREIGRALADGVELYDPVPAAMVRLAGRERAQLLVQSLSRPRLHAFLGAWRDLLAAEKSSAARWALDVDPIDL